MLECAELAGQRTGVRLRLRIGFHSGSVVAGVIRADKGRFQLFGDTVRLPAGVPSGRCRIRSANDRPALPLHNNR